ncbi:hypothetical protein FLONG3_1329 [Fusarium longipes]|uniref:Uncharacterized protein n=1 Tax=Fusarium longipes TaxID=694270 RepID=A0A395T7A2_9HYPO|nr:hypothetical protein FLONG3_1329 [Fusarium longipes]
MLFKHFLLQVLATLITVNALPVVDDVEPGLEARDQYYPPPPNQYGYCGRDATLQNANVLMARSGGIDGASAHMIQPGTLMGSRVVDIPLQRGRQRHLSTQLLGDQQLLPNTQLPGDQQLLPSTQLPGVQQLLPGTQPLDGKQPHQSQQQRGDLPPQGDQQLLPSTQLPGIQQLLPDIQLLDGQQLHQSQQQRGDLPPQGDQQQPPGIPQREGRQLLLSTQLLGTVNHHNKINYYQAIYNNNKQFNHEENNYVYKAHDNKQFDYIS